MRGELAQFHGIGAAALHCRRRIPKHVYHGELQAGERHRIRPASRLGNAARGPHWPLL